MLQEFPWKIYLSFNLVSFPWILNFADSFYFPNFLIINISIKTSPGNLSMCPGNMSGGQGNVSGGLGHLSGGPWNVSINARNGTNALENVPAVNISRKFQLFLHMFPGDFFGFQDNSCSPTPQGSMDNCPFVPTYNIVGAIALWFHKFYSHSHAVLYWIYP